MILQEIEYQGFRNLADGKISFCKGLNIIAGNNGAGKTNLLEAIFFAAYGTSFRTVDDRNMVKFNEPYMMVTGLSDNINASVFYNGTKRFTINGNEKSRQSEYIGWLPVVVMSLNDIWIISGAPVKRRDFIDSLLIKIHPVYGVDLNEFKKILKQRNLLLQQVNRDYTLLEIYNEQFINWANVIYDERRKIIPIIKEMIEIKGRELGFENTTFEYLGSCPDMKLSADVLKRVEPLEFENCTTIVGPHRDDFVIRLNGHPVKIFASEGECRLFALLLKLIEAEVIKQRLNIEPVFLLDEVATELDHNHRRHFFEMINGQIFYATVQDLGDIGIADKKRFVVKRGNIVLS